MNINILYGITNNVVLTKGLTYYWKLDGNVNAAVGTALTAAGAVAYVTGILGQAANLGTGAAVIYYTFSRTASSSFTDGTHDLPFSISFWVYKVAAGTHYFITRRASSNFEWSFQSTATTVSCNLFSNNTSNSLNFSLTISLSLNAWHHIVYAYNGDETTTGMRIYVDGIQYNPTGTITGSYTGMALNTLATPDVGQNGASEVAANNLKGYIDELGIWRNRVLTGSYVARLYNYGVGRTHPF